MSSRHKAKGKLFIQGKFTKTWLIEEEFVALEPPPAISLMLSMISISHECRKGWALSLLSSQTLCPQEGQAAKVLIPTNQVAESKFLVWPIS